MDSVTTQGPRPWLAVGREVSDLLGSVDERQFFALVESFRSHDRRWFFGGQGRSGLIATMAAMRFMHLGRRTHVIGEATAPAVRSGDGVVLVSGSGETAVTVHLAKIARQEGAFLIALTGSAQSTLSAIADSSLVLPVERTEQLGGSLFEQTALLVLDAVVLYLAIGNPDAQAMLRRLHTNMQ